MQDASRGQYDLDACIDSLLALLQQCETERHILTQCCTKARLALSPPPLTPSPGVHPPPTEHTAPSSRRTSAKTDTANAPSKPNTPLLADCSGAAVDDAPVDPELLRAERALDSILQRAQRIRNAESEAVARVPSSRATGASSAASGDRRIPTAVRASATASSRSDKRTAAQTLSTGAKGTSARADGGAVSAKMRSRAAAANTGPNSSPAAAPKAADPASKPHPSVRNLPSQPAPKSSTASAGRGAPKASGSASGKPTQAHSRVTTSARSTGPRVSTTAPASATSSAPAKPKSTVGANAIREKDSAPLQSPRPPIDSRRPFHKGGGFVDEGESDSGSRVSPTPGGRLDSDSDVCEDSAAPQLHSSAAPTEEPPTDFPREMHRLSASLRTHADAAFGWEASAAPEVGAFLGAIESRGYCQKWTSADEHAHLWPDRSDLARLLSDVESLAEAVADIQKQQPSRDASVTGNDVDRDRSSVADHYRAARTLRVARDAIAAVDSIVGALDPARYIERCVSQLGPSTTHGDGNAGGCGILNGGGVHGGHDACSQMLHALDARPRMPLAVSRAADIARCESALSALRRWDDDQALRRRLYESALVLLGGDGRDLEDAGDRRVYRLLYGLLLRGHSAAMPAFVDASSLGEALDFAV